MIVLEGSRKPIKMWANEAEEEALQQARNAANHPLTFGHVALMGDVHSGYSVPIGGVWVIGKNEDGELSVCSSAVGYDIGCGVVCQSTELDAKDVPQEVLMNIAEDIRNQVPAGVGSRSKGGLKLPAIPDGTTRKDMPIVDRDWNEAETQLGSLGGGKLLPPAAVMQ